MDSYSEQSLQREKEVLKPLFTAPFEHIALAFSGGGFRAAAYSLGVLSYLNTVSFKEGNEQKKLLDKVTYLSSASGGSIATSLFTFYSARGKSFDEYYKKLFTQLSDDVLLKNALNILKSENEWKERPGKSRNLINAFALAYDRYLFDKATLESVLPENNEEAKTHIEEVCFNATEFIYGLLFHQQVKLKKDSYNDSYFFYGNYLTHLEREISYKIRLSDIVAASSCFPAAFEPIIFPDDFVNPHLTAEELRKGLHIQAQRDDMRERKFIKEKTLGLMDGGITDNQGLESMMEADSRRQKKETDFLPFDLMLVNDVASYFMNSLCCASCDAKIFDWNLYL